MPSLLVTHGNHFGVRYPLLSHTTLGRSSGCSIQLLDEKVSRLHTTVLKEGERFVLRDEGSSNGTGHNGRLLLEPTELAPGDEIAVGNNLLLFDPAIDILLDLAGSGAVVIATPPDVSAVAAGRREPNPVRVDSLLRAVAELLASPRGLGRPTALLEAAARALGAERAALLLAPTGGEPLKAVATWPHRSRVGIARSVLTHVLDERRVTRSIGTLELTVRQGRSFIENRGGASLAVPILRGGRLRGAVYMDVSTPGAFDGLDLDGLSSVLALTFAPLFSGSPELLRPAVDRSERPLPALDSPATARLLEQARALAESGQPALLHGERGAGREHIARQLHRMGPRSEGPFLALHCGGFSRETAERLVFGWEADHPAATAKAPARIAEADGGTLFLDHLEELAPPLQIRLLRLLQEGRYQPVGSTRSRRIDLRILVGVTRDLDELIRNGALRADLVEHLGQHRIHIPPLRERLADIAPLVRYFVAEFEGLHGPLTRGFTAEALGLLEAQEWPGNVQELRDVVQRVLIRARGEQVEGSDVRSELDALPSRKGVPESPADRASMMRRMEADLVARALGRARGSRARAASMLGIGRPELDRRIAAWNLDAYGS